MKFVWSREGPIRGPHGGGGRKGQAEMDRDLRCDNGPGLARAEEIVPRMGWIRPSLDRKIPLHEQKGGLHGPKIGPQLSRPSRTTLESFLLAIKNTRRSY